MIRCKGVVMKYAYITVLFLAVSLRAMEEIPFDKETAISDILDAADLNEREIKKYKKALENLDEENIVTLQGRMIKRAKRSEGEGKKAKKEDFLSAYIQVLEKQNAIEAGKLKVAQEGAIADQKNKDRSYHQSEDQFIRSSDSTNRRFWAGQVVTVSMLAISIACNIWQARTSSQDIAPADILSQCIELFKNCTCYF